MIEPFTIPNLQPYFQQITESIRTTFEEIQKQQKALNTNWNAAFQNIGELWKRLPDEVRETTLFISELGWYPSLSLEITVFQELGQIAKSNDIQGADTVLSNWYRSNLDEGIDWPIKEYPHREKMIRDALFAHKHGLYSLSIPAFLIQSEGICQEVLGEKLFSTDKGAPKIKPILESRKRGPFSTAFLLPFLGPSGLTASPKYRTKYPFALNRHEVLHGTSSDYATELNSLKSISLFIYCAETLPPHANE